MYNCSPKSCPYQLKYSACSVVTIHRAQLADKTLNNSIFKPRLHDTTGCQTTTGCHSGCTTGLYNRFDNRLYRVNKHPTGCQISCHTSLTTG